MAPPMRPEWHSAWAQDQRLMARRIVVVVALVALVLLPILQGLEYFLFYTNEDLWWQRLFLRVPLALMALLVLALRCGWPDGPWPRPMALFFGATLVAIGFGILQLHVAVDGADFHYTIHALSMSLPGLALLATRGLRDLLLIYLVPLLVLLLLAWWLQLGSLEHAGLLAYPLLSMLLGAVIAEMLHRSNWQAFVAQRHLECSAATDTLTDLPNRRAADALLAVEHARARRGSGSYAVIMADLDRFKRVNDTYGHDVGDEVLTALAGRLRAAMRTGDHVTRWGGEEFLVMLPAADAAGAMEAAEKLRRSVADAPLPTCRGGLAVTISLGVALYAGESTPEEVVRRADQALYSAKERGRNCSVLAPAAGRFSA